MTDLCGAMVEVGDIEDLQEMQGNQIFADNQIRIQFSMIDTECVLHIFYLLCLKHFILSNSLNYSSLTQVRCAAYGSVAEKLYQYRIASNANFIVCVLKLWRIERRNGKLFNEYNIIDIKY